MGVGMERWGRDHWSTFGYIEVRVVDHGGVPDREHMRTHPELHPLLGGHELARSGVRKLTMKAFYPTRLRGHMTIEPHDDWSCLDDAEEAGLVKNVGTGVNRRYVLTEFGREVAAALRAHKAAGKNVADFVWQPQSASVAP